MGMLQRSTVQHVTPAGVCLDGPADATMATHPVGTMLTSLMCRYPGGTMYSIWEYLLPNCRDDLIVITLYML